MCGEPRGAFSVKPLSWDYPRVCGEPRGAFSVKPLSWDYPRVCGESGTGFGALTCDTDYPRVCGGTGVKSKYPTEYSILGLSPRVRGNLFDSSKYCPFSRTIPACAGEPNPVIDNCSIYEDYPRVCGGTHSRDIHIRPEGGITGKLNVNFLTGHPYTPGGRFGRVIISLSSAGTSIYARREVYAKIAYFLLQRDIHIRPEGGLSPRVRGNPRRSISCSGSKGTIPACAGEPLHQAKHEFHIWDYPRVCGGTLYQPAIHAEPIRLSPRVRGNPISRAVIRKLIRTIPACAGEPFIDQLCRAINKDYPCVCGGTQRLCSLHDLHPGLSPRVRGNLAGSSERARFSWTIPACAGEPVLSSQ